MPEERAQQSGAAHRQVAWRIGLLVVGFAAWAGLVVILGAWHGQSETIVVGGGPTTRPVSQTIYEVNPGPVTAIALAALAGLLVVTASVVWRIRRRSPRVGVSALVVACVLGAAAVVGMLSIGPLLLPLALCCTVEALPMSRLAPSAAAVSYDPGP